MAKNNKYWQERFEQIEQAANNKAVRHNSKLEKKYRQAAEEIDAQINKWYNRIAKNNMMSISEARRLLTASELKEFKWSVEEYIEYGRQNALDQQWVKELENASAKFHINRLEAMKLEVRHQVEMAMANGQQDMFDVLGDVYKDTFYRSSFELQKGVGIGFDVAKLDDKTVYNVLSKPWAADGSNFSDKLWSNKKKLINTLDQELSRMVLLGDTPDRAIKTIKDAMDSSLFQAKRLVLTEQAYFATEAQKKAFNSLDVERYEIVSSADRKVCSVCAAKDKKNFPMIEFHIGITAPPFHPLCRCVTAPFFDDEFASKTRIVKDGKGEKHEIPATMNYQEWKDAFLKDNPEEEKEFKKAQNETSDRTQYKALRERLGKEHVPATFGEFQNIKYGNPTEYGILKAQNKGMTYYEKAVENEPLITSSVKGVAKQSDLETYGLEHRLKTKDSYLRKIRSEYNPDGNTYEVKDIIRYTLGTKNPDELTDKIGIAIDSFTGAGYNTVVVKNSWYSKKNPYRGINTTIVAPNGQKFEVQYHTKESFDLKNGKMHELYERARLLDDDSVELIELRKEMFALSKELHIPKGIERVKSYGNYQV